MAANWSHPSYAEGFPNLGFEVVTGTVCASTVLSTTHVSGTRNYVTSYADISREFFIRRDGDGLSVEFRFVNRNLSVYEGQRISVISAFVPGRGPGSWIRLVNHDTESVHVVCETPVVSSRLGLSMSVGAVFGVASAWAGGFFVLMAILADILMRIPDLERLGGWCIAAMFLGSPLIWLVYFFSNYSKHSMRAARLDGRFNQVAQDVLNHVRQSRAAAG